ncbi:unnamed protein product, partial [Didymodactylos carnosus]
MGNTDSLPVISQAKSVVQLIAGNSEGAARTHKNFVKGCPVLLQAVAFGALTQGKIGFAKESQIYFLKNMSNVADSIPVVGHAKGLIHYYILGDMEGCNEAIKSASRSVGVAAGGIRGFTAGGPISGYAGGELGGIAADIVISVADTIVHREFRLCGHIQSLRRIVDGKMEAGEGFDWALTPVFDGLAG